MLTSATADQTAQTIATIQAKAALPSRDNRSSGEAGRCGGHQHSFFDPTSVRTLKDSPNTKAPKRPTNNAEAAATYVLISEDRL